MCWGSLSLRGAERRSNLHSVIGGCDEGPVSGCSGRSGGRVPSRGAPGRPAGDSAGTPEMPPDELPGLLAGYDFMFDDHTQLPTETMRRCTGLKHIIFLGTGARSYMNPDELAEHRHHRAHHQGLWRHGSRRAHDRADVGRSAGLARMDGGMRPANGSAPREWNSPARRSVCWASAASRPRWRASPAGPACGCWPGTARPRPRRA